MNAHGQSHPQGPFPSGMPSQQQNMGAPRGAPNPAQTTAKQPNFPGACGQYALGNEHLLDPQVSLWTIAKPIQTTSWDDVEPEQLCVSKQDIMRRMAKFHKKGEDPADVLINIRSQNARKAVNELVEQQNERLWEYNPTIYYYIASIQVDKEIIKCWPAGEKKRIKRIDIILKTEPRPHHEIPKAFLDAMRPPKPSSGGKDSYSSQGGVGQGGAQGPKGSQGGNPGQNNNMSSQGARGPQGPGPNNGPPHNQSQGQPQGQFTGPHGGIPPPPPPPTNGPPPNQGQFNQPGGPGGNIPPPPPPPNGPFGPQGHGGGIPPPPPPAPGPPRQPQAQPIPPPHQMPQPGRTTMPGAFPGANSQPRVEVLDPRILKDKKAAPKGRHDPRDSSASDSESLSDVSVEGGFRYVARSRSRGHNDYRRSRSRSLNRGHTRNRSRDRNNITKNYKDQRYGRTRSDIESPHRLRHSSNTSPNSSNPAIQPQNIFNIKIDNDNERAKKKGRDGHRRTRDPLRTTNSISPPHFPPNPYRGQDKYAAEAMYRSSSNNGSDSESSYAGTSSIYTESDRSIFSEPEHHYTKQVPFRPPPHMQHSRDDGFARPPFDYDPRGAAKHHYPGPNDYPAQRTGNSSPKYDDHIMPPGSPWPRPPQPHRRHSQQNPFEPGSRYAGGYGGYGHEQTPLRYLTEREHDQELNDLANAFLDKMQQRRQGHPGRRSSVRMPGRLGVDVDTDEWANPGERFETGHPRYDGHRHTA